MKELLKKIKNTEYDLYYISIGSGIRERQVRFGVNKRVQTNSKLQIYPNFLKNKNALNILIEPNITSETRQFIANKNIDILEYEIVKDSNEWEKSNFYIFFQKLINILNTKRVPLHKVIIINYIKFKVRDENHINEELFFSQKIFNALSYPINQIETESNEHKIYYNKCFYEWFGYNAIFYNCIYKYKFYDNSENKYKNFLTTFSPILDYGFIFISFLGKERHKYKTNINTYLNRFFEDFIGSNLLKKKSISNLYKLMLNNTFSLYSNDFYPIFNYYEE